jgi:hypothetical protein
MHIFVFQTLRKQQSGAELCFDIMVPTSAALQAVICCQNGTLCLCWQLLLLHQGRGDAARGHGAGGALHPPHRGRLAAHPGDRRPGQPVGLGLEQGVEISGLRDQKNVSHGRPGHPVGLGLEQGADSDTCA